MSGKSAKAFLAQVGSFLPTPALLIFGQWNAAFTRIGLANPTWESSAGAVGTAVGAVVSLVSLQMVDRQNTIRVKKIARFCTIAFVVLIVACFVLGGNLDDIHGGPVRAFLNQFWRFMFAAAMCVLCIALTFAAMANPSDTHWVFWLCVVLGVIVVAVVGFGVFRYFIVCPAPS
jgi:cytochrome bd-type quinol oxidase subunit 2